MSTITAIMEADADGTLHLPVPEALRHGRMKVVAEIERISEEPSPAGHESSDQDMLQIMEDIVALNPFQYMPDPVAWQREVREDVTLPWPKTN